MAFYSDLHVLKKIGMGGDKVSIVKYGKSFSSTNDVISVIELGTSQAYSMEEMSGSLSVAQNGSGNDRVAACVSFRNEQPSAPSGPGQPPSPPSYTYRLNFWSVETSGDSSLIGSPTGLKTDDNGTPVNLIECIGVNAGTDGVDYALVRNGNEKLMLLQTSAGTS